MATDILSTPASGPDPADWLAAFLRGFHPVRWAVCLGGLAVTWAMVAVAQSLCDGQAPRWVEWWQDPASQARALGDAVAARSPWAWVFRLGPALAVVLAAWSLSGAWVARHELLARFRARLEFDPAPDPGPSGLVTSRAKELVLCSPAVLLIAAITLLPGFFAAWLGTWGVGAVLAAIVLPVVLVTNLLAVCLIFGALAWPLMPMTLATEYSDTFDALSRAYNYAFMRPVRFLFLLACSVVLAGLPLAAALLGLDGPLAGWPPIARQAIVWLAAGLSASIFWSLQTLVYLHLRTTVDGTDASELAAAPGPEDVGSPPPAAATDQAPKGNTAATDKPAPAKAQAGWPTASFMAFLGVVASWFFTVWLFARVGGDDGRWLAWGLVEGFIPPAAGAYKIASVIGALWGVAWLCLPLVMFARGRRTAARESAAEEAAKVTERSIQ